MGDLHARGAVTITGAGGYIGRHVITAVADRGLTPVAVVRPGKAASVNLDARARVVEADVLAEGFDVGDIVDADTAALIHLAWHDGFIHNSPAHLAHLGSHMGLLTAVADAGVPRIAILGTMHEVGYWEGAITADTPTAPRSLYGIAKDALRRASMLTLSERVGLAWLRCYYIYGDDRRSNSIFGRLLSAVDDGKQTFPFTTGRNEYDFIDVEELARQIATAAGDPEAVGIINCSSGRPTSLAEQVEKFIAAHELPIRLEYGAFPDRPYDSPRIWGDATAIDEIMRRDASRAERPRG